MSSTYLSTRPISRGHYLDRRLTKGEVFGRLTVIHQHIFSNWCACRCACGSTVFKQALRLRSKDVISCGCARIDANVSRNKARATHNDSHTYMYSTWQRIKSRCYNEFDKDYKNYGARGICLEASWLVDYNKFKHDMGERPSTTHTINRIDNNGPYSKDNCEWATPKKQAQNRRSTVHITYAGQTQCLTAWSEQVGVAFDTLRRRIFVLGWSIDKALTTPSRRWVRHDSRR